MEIGIIADTHSFFDPNLPEIFAGVDEIWHAGDFGEATVAEQLAAIKPMKGVYGNIDTEDIREQYPEDLWFEIEGVTVWMTHIAGRPGRYDRRVYQGLTAKKPDVLVCGHSHMLVVQRDPKFDNMLYLNPGAAGHHGFHKKRTLLKCRVADGKVDKLRIIELGQRGRKRNSS